VFIQTTTTIVFTIAGLTSPTVNVLNTAGAIIGSVTGTNSPFTWTNTSGGSVALGATDVIGLNVADAV
jgi:hypothetical protein